MPEVRYFVSAEDRTLANDLQFGGNLGGTPTRVASRWLGHARLWIISPRSHSNLAGPDVTERDQRMLAVILRKIVVIVNQTDRVFQPANYRDGFVGVPFYMGHHLTYGQQLDLPLPTLLRVSMAKG